MNHFWKFSFSLIIVFTVSILTGIAPSKDSKSTGIVLDTMNNSVELLLKDGMPTEYVSDIFTPVCTSSDCMPIRIRIYWDFAGNYVRYELPENEILTKIDHLPFTAEDYLQLDKILKDPNSRLKDFNMDELVQPGQAKSEVDGVTGATDVALKNSFVPGALYSCYTLWHLVHTHAQSEILNYSNQFIFKQYPLNYFTANSNAASQLAALAYQIENTTDNSSIDQQLINIIDSADTQLALIVIQLVPDNSLSHANMQETLLNHYGKTNLDITKTEIIKRLKTETLSLSAIEILSQQLLHQMPYFETSVEILDQQTQWSAKTSATILTLINQTSHLKQKESLYYLLYDKGALLDKKTLKSLEKVAKANYFEFE
ncbi:hypothetical protein [Crocinitomix catalasitica]|uniref:hypothetical protein n=1 Tax=Crocinitomix catalasitica TaxID=184607 RepID=UPI0006888F23|nr:hypothetical protein [Crocinitomix catalasitica]